MGWSSQGMNAQKANRIRSEIVKNIKEGKGFQSLREKRQIEIDRRRAEEKAKLLKEKNKISFGKAATEYLKWSKAKKRVLMQIKAGIKIILNILMIIL